ncbi:hypothetical protein EXIGLDRAFT_454481 [Exidia glandulosa HHB12029]|uniref:GmrSD restriction endonucleases C-terminal domain-containing protein n=1 Tax=Exidia glandulosa HHB12029 TaxID=1314781 RepID=A0A165B1W6_EXIGL|nr:hypothetical protein EXIGLDRAFT_454481 [Exidia glandulosa HHB12029]
MRTCVIAAFAVATAVFAAPAPDVTSRALPSVIAASTARTRLAGLTVATPSNSPAYDRDLFKTWDTISGTCDTRETVLKRDGTGVTVSSACTPTAGSWTSAYDGLVTTNASSFDIDHLVPLKEAWISGARSWTNASREAFANDLTRPQLLAVSAHENRSKGDSDVTEYLPPLASFQCTYVRAWVQDFYGLTIDSAEKTKLTSILSGC